MTEPLDIEKNFLSVKKRIATACEEAGRDPNEICLLAVSKTKPIEMVNSANLTGQIHFAENYAQDFKKIPHFG